MKFPGRAMKFPESVSKFPESALKFPNGVMEFAESGLKFSGSVLEFPGCGVKLADRVAKFVASVLKWAAGGEIFSGSVIKPTRQRRGFAWRLSGIENREGYAPLRVLRASLVHLRRRLPHRPRGAAGEAAQARAATGSLESHSR
jgi:hypothetical protein